MRERVAPGLRVTRDGAVALAASVALLGAGVLSGNNLVYLVAAPLWAAVLLAVPLGFANLRGLGVRRQLPAELVAGRDGAGRLLLRNGRRRLAARDLRLIDEGSGAVGRCEEVAAGAVEGIPVRWRFADRGRTRLSAISVSSSWPLGLFEHVLTLRMPAELVVYPRPLPAAAPPKTSERGGVEELELGRGTGDFVGIRPWREGDGRRGIHWMSTARTGAWMVVERAGETEVTVEIEVHPAVGLGWERELSRAAGEVGRAFQHGRKVGLRLPGPQAQRLEPQGGPAWRRTLLEVLALQPRRVDDRAGSET
ncbi:MAG: DUF58 domain-containing protein [Alphaproteobacteria bacterium]|nr:DUF58 domain-containing protein [Alphaproteobacteria bacterium]